MINFIDILIKFTVDQLSLKEIETEPSENSRNKNSTSDAAIACSIENKENCLMCSG